MALGGTAKKIQKLADTAERLYEQSKELQQRMVNLEESVDESTERLDRLEVESEKQRVLLEALAEERGIDVEQVLAEAAIAEAEPADGAGEGADEASAAEGTPASDAEDLADPDEPAAGDDGPTVVDEQGDTVE